MVVAIILQRSFNLAHSDVALTVIGCLNLDSGNRTQI
jgi:hypothetical protein